QSSVLSPQSLFPNTTYYFRAGNMTGGTTYYDFTVPQATSTLANRVSNVTLQVFTSSLTVAWAALPASPSSATAEGYLLQASSMSDYSGTLYSSAATGIAASTLTVSGLPTGTTFYLRVGS